MPLKPFQSLMTLFLQSLSMGDEVPSVRELPRKLPSDFREVQDDFWIGSFEKLLPSSWVQQGVISDKAAKANDAKIHTGLWDQRVTRVMPAVAERDLEFVRHLCSICAGVNV